MSEEYIYQRRAVAFLDVLGFQEKLKEFEKEAITLKEEQKDAEFENLDTGQYLKSKNANDFINTFLDAISLLDKEKFQYYLFSDNICITLKQADDQTLLIDLLNIITDLFYSFAKKGYFLRGGIDFGNFINQDSIALGVPLAVAYKLEQTDAVYPRIIISENFKKVFEDYSNSERTDFSSSHQLYINKLIQQSCEINYLNVFMKVLKTDDKESFFQELHESIKNNLLLNLEREKIFIKYQWLANEFNKFIDIYTESLAFTDENFEPSGDFIEMVKSLKLTEHAN